MVFHVVSHEPRMEMERWEGSVRSLLRKHLGGESDRFLRESFTAPRVEQGPDALLDAMKARIDYVISECQGLLELAPPPGPATVRPPEDRFAELRRSGLIDEATLNSYIRRMSKAGSKAQLADAIGAAKELVEACAVAVIEVLGGAPNAQDFGRLMKSARSLLAVQLPDDPTQQAAVGIDYIGQGCAMLESGLTTTRNAVGTGHGRTRYAPGLRPRHAQLAIDVADSHARWLVTSLADAKRL